MLTQLRFENFKSWQAAKLPLAPLTALFGANSSGKSSLLQFLLLLKQTKEFYGSLARVGLWRARLLPPI